MAELWLPGKHPLVRSSRGWPSSPNVKPSGELRPKGIYAQADQIYIANQTINRTLGSNPQDITLVGMKQERGGVNVSDPTLGSYVSFPIRAMRDSGTVFVCYINLELDDFDRACSHINMSATYWNNANQYLVFGIGITASKVSDYGKLFTIAYRSPSTDFNANRQRYLCIDNKISSTDTLTEAYGPGQLNPLYIGDTGANKAGEGIYYFAIADSRIWSDQEIRKALRDPWSLFESANQTPYLVGVSGAAPPPAFDETARVAATMQVTAQETFSPPSPGFDETARVDSSATVTANETYSAPSYTETANLQASVTVTATETFGTVYDETARVDAAATVTATETFTAPVYTETALVSATMLVTATESFGTAYAETARIDATATVTASEVYTPPVPAFDETAQVSINCTVSVAETFIGPSYNETSRIDVSMLVTATESFGTAYNETARVDATTTVTATEVWTPPSYTEKALVESRLILTAREIFDTPSRLPEGITILSAERVGGFIARKI